MMATTEIMAQHYQVGDKIVAILNNEDDQKLEVSVHDSSNIPGLLIGLIVEKGAPSQDTKKWRRQLQGRLHTLCQAGSFVTRVAISATEFYPLRADNADATFDFIITRLATILEISELEPKLKKKKSMPTFAAVKPPPCSNPEELEKLRHPKGAVDHIVVRISIEELLVKMVPPDPRRITASASIPDRAWDAVNEKGIAVMTVNTEELELLELDVGDGKEFLRQMVQEVSGRWGIKLRAAFFSTGHQELVKHFPILLTVDETPNKTAAMRRKELRAAFEGGLGQVERKVLEGREQAASLLNLPTALLSTVQEFVGKQLVVRELNRACSGGVTEGLTQLTLSAPGGEGDEGGADGAGASLMARGTVVRNLRLRDIAALEEFVLLFLQCGWWLGSLRSLEIDTWQSVTIGQTSSIAKLRTIMEGILRRTFNDLKELKVALTDLVYDTATQASAMMVEITFRMPNLTHLELTAPGRVGVTRADVRGLAAALKGGKLRHLALDVDCREEEENGDTPLRALLDNHPHLTSLNLQWKFALKWVPSSMQLGARKPRGEANVRGDVAAVAATLPKLPRLRSLTLGGDVCIKNVSAGPILTALGQAHRVRLTHLALRCFVYDAGSCGKLVRSGRLDALEQLSLTSCEGLHWWHITSILREANLPHGQSHLRHLRDIDVSFSPLFTADEQEQAKLGFLVASPPTLPPLLRRITMATRPPLSKEMVDNLKHIFPTVIIDA